MVEIMTENVTNNGYTRCRECSEVYECTKKSCPKCGTANNNSQLNENKSDFISEAVFNVID